MARSAQDIKTALGKSVWEADPSADLNKGPIADLMLFPVSSELASLEQRVEDLRVLTSLQLDKVVTEEEITAIGTSFGLPPITGKASQYRQTFWTFTRPTVDRPIERGTVVGTSDASRTFVVIERVVMLASNADAYFNATRRRYEITAKVEATSIGTASNLPAYRIKRLVTKLVGFDGTENRAEPSVLGVDRQDFSAYLKRIQKKFLGLNPEAGAGITSRILEYSPGDVLDISLVYPKDRDVFRRDTGRPAIDAYIIGETADSIQQRYIAIGGETSIVLEKAPAISVDEVRIDGESNTSYSLLADPNPSLTGTAKAQDVVVLSTPLTPGQVVEITSTYNALIYGIQNDLFGEDTREFGTDILIRVPVNVPISIQIDVTLLPSFDSNRTTDAVNEIVFGYVESDTFITSLLPETLQQRILDGVAGVSSVKIQRFTPTTSGVLPVETITLKKNQVPKVDQNYLKIVTHQ